MDKESPFSQSFSGTSNFSAVSSPLSKQPVSAASTQKSRSFQKFQEIDSLFHLVNLSEALMTRLYILRQTLEYPEPGVHQYSNSLWKSGIFPDLPKLCIHIAKKFPEHPSRLQLEKIDKAALDQFSENAEAHLIAMEPWFMVLLDLMRFREQALKAILDLSSTVITFLPHQNPLLLHAFMNLFCSFVRVNLLSDKVPRKMLIQAYNLSHIMLKSGKDHELYHRLVQFVDSYDPPMKGLHDDLNFVSPRMGEILEAIGPTVFLCTDYQKLRNEGFLSPFHPRYPEKLTNSAHPARSQELVNAACYRDWVLFGYLVCPLELLRPSGMDIAMAVLKDTLVLPIFRDEFILVHEEYQLYVLPKISESKKIAKAGRVKQKDSDQEYSVAKQVERVICDVHDAATTKAEGVHREQRTVLKLELGRMVTFFTDQPSLIAPNVQMVFSALAMARFEVVWYFTHVGVLCGKSKGARVVPVDIDVSDPTIGFILDSMEKLSGLIRKYVSGIRGYALGYLGGVVERIKFLLGTPGMIALDIDTDLQSLLASVSNRLDNLPKFQNEKVVTATISLSEFRKEWLLIVALVSSSQHPVNIRNLEKATISTGKESIISEGNMAYLWSRCVDDVENQLSEHSSLKALCFHRQHLTTVFRHTMFGPEGRPQHCCAWLGIASSFPENVNPDVPEEQERLAGDAISYAESILESIMGGFEGLVNILYSEGGFGSLEYKLLPDQAACRMSQAVKYGSISSRSIRHIPDLPLPGSESEPSNRDSIKMLEAAVQRLTSLCTVLNHMEPVCVLNHVFVPQEYLRDHVERNFQRRLLNIVKVDADLQRPSVFEALLHRHMHIIHLIEQHVNIDLTKSIREVLLAESFTGPMQDLQGSPIIDTPGGITVSTICEWFIENIVKDVANASVVFSPLDNSFRSCRPVGGFSAEAMSDLSELRAFVRVFGPYGIDKFDKLLQEYLCKTLNCIAVILHSNKDSLEAFARCMHNRVERDLRLKQILELEALMAFSLQLGHTLSFRSLLAEASAAVLEADAPLLFSLLSNFSKHSPFSIPEKQEIHKVKVLASRMGALDEQDSTILRSILGEMELMNDASSILLPYLYAGCMTSQIWNSSAFTIHTGGFNNNVQCLARCINALLVATEFARSDNKKLRTQFSQQDMSKKDNEMGEVKPEIPNLEEPAALEVNIKSTMKAFVQCSATIALSGWNESNRSPLVAKLIFLDQLCDLSKYLPRSTLEAHIPYTILSSVYQLYYENAVPTLVLISPSRRNASAPHGTTRNIGFIHDAGNESNDGFPNFRGSLFSSTTNKPSAQRRKPILDMESSNGTQTEMNHTRVRVTRLSGPLDYGGIQRANPTNGCMPEGTHVASSVQSVSSKSGPITYV